MKNIKKNASLFCAMFLITLISFAQKDNFNSLIDMKGTYLDQEMKNRGYRFIKTEKSGNDAYQNWFNDNKNKCVTVRVSNGRVVSVVDSPAFDCQGNQGNKGNQSNMSGQYKDLKGWVASSAYDELGARGYREVERYKKDRLWIVWKHNPSGKCIKTGEDGGKIKEVAESEKCY